MGGGVQSDQFSTIKYNGLIDIIVIILQLQGPGGGSPPALYIYTIYLFQRLGADIQYTVPTNLENTVMHFPHSEDLEAVIDLLHYFCVTVEK